MTINDIRNYAEIIWGVLIRKGQMSLREIGEQTKLKDVSIYAALGWLLREDKIWITNVSDSINVEVTNLGTEQFY